MRVPSPSWSSRRQKETQLAEEKFPALLNEIQRKRDQALKEAEEKYPRGVAEIQQRFERESHQLQEAYRARKRRPRGCTTRPGTPWRRAGRTD